MHFTFPAVAPLGYTDNCCDCDDSNANVHDKDTVYYEDDDEDGFGNAAVASNGVDCPAPGENVSCVHVCVSVRVCVFVCLFGVCVFVCGCVRVLFCRYSSPPPSSTFVFIRP